MHRFWVEVVEALKSIEAGADPFGTMNTQLCTSVVSLAAHVACGAVVALVVLAGPVRAATPPAHLEAACATCHRLDHGVDTGTATALRGASCGGCHGPDRAAGWGTAAFHDGDTQRCATCHSFHTSDQVRIATAGAVIEFPLASLEREASAKDLVQCTPCHRSGGPSPALLDDGHRAAALWYHANVSLVGTQSVSASCLRCHDSTQALPEELPPGFDPPRPSPAAGHVTGVAVPRRARSGYGTEPPTDPRLPLVQGRIECTTCHDLFNPSNDRLAQFEPRDTMCLGCHVRSYDGSKTTGVALAR